MRILVTKSLFAFAAVLAFAASTLAADFLPNLPTDKATFAQTRGGASVEMKVESVSGGWKLWSNFAGLGRTWIYTFDTNDKVYVWSSVRNTYQLFADFRSPQGTATRIDIAPCNKGQVIVAERNIAVQTAGGSFPDCIRLELRTSCADAGVTSIWFAARVGVVKWEQQSIAGPRTYELASGTLNGQTFPQGSGLAVSATFPQHAFVNMMPGPGPRTPSKVTVSIAAKNETADALKYQFMGGQRFEITLEDAQGVAVAKWSRGRAFTREIRIIEMQPGDTLSYSGELELVTDAGAPVPQGNYTLRIELTSSPLDGTAHQQGSRRIAAESPITIGWVY